MVNTMTVGLSGVRMLRKHSKVPIVAHFDMIAPFTRVPYYGIDSNVIVTLQRMVGFDAIIFPGLGARMRTSDQEVIANVGPMPEAAGQTQALLACSCRKPVGCDDT